MRSEESILHYGLWCKLEMVSDLNFYVALFFSDECVRLFFASTSQSFSAHILQTRAHLAYILAKIRFEKMSGLFGPLDLLIQHHSTFSWKYT